MDKMDNEYFVSISDVSARLSVPAHTLRYWEKQFPIAVRPTTGVGGRRYYRTETVKKLLVIKDLLYSRGMTIAGVKKLLRDGELPDNIGGLDFCGGADGAVQKKSLPTDIDRVIDLLAAAREILV